MNRTRLCDGLSVSAIALVALVLLDTARSLSVTCDEVPFIGASVSYVTHGEQLVTAEAPPLQKLVTGLALRGLTVHEGESAGPFWSRLQKAPDPWAEYHYSEALIFTDNAEFQVPLAKKGGDSVVVAARVANLIFPLLLLVVAWRFARGRFGAPGGLVAVALLGTYPDFLGHGALARQDVPLAAMGLLATFALDRYWREGSLRWAIVLGLALGAALAIKLSALFLLLGVALAAVIARPRGDAKTLVGHVAVAAAVGFLVLWVSFLGRDPISGYRHALSVLRAAYASSFDGIIFGERRHGPWWHYFAIAWALKAPLGTIVLLAALVPKLRRTDLREEAILHVPAIVFFVAVSLTSRPFGSRYLLPAVVLALVSAGRLARWRREILAVCLAWNVAASFRDHPFHQGSTNRLGASPQGFYRVLDDSAQDWGGGLKALAKWQRERGVPRVSVLPFAARPYRIARGGAPFALAILPENVFPWLGHLEAYGVEGELVRESVVFTPERGRVYAVSAHVLAWAHATEREWARAGPQHPRMVLGGLEPPSELVGGFLIFDRR